MEGGGFKEVDEKRLIFQVENRPYFAGAKLS